MVDTISRQSAFSGGIDNIRDTVTVFQPSREVSMQFEQPEQMPVPSTLRMKKVGINVQDLPEEEDDDFSDVGSVKSYKSGKSGKS